MNVNYKRVHIIKYDSIFDDIEIINFKYKYFIFKIYKSRFFGTVITHELVISDSSSNSETYKICHPELDKLMKIAIFKLIEIKRYEL